MTSPAKRLNTRRPFHVTPQGLKRIILGEIGAAGTLQHFAAHHETAPKPLRLTQAPTNHILVIAHTDRGGFDAQAQQAIAAAALLARADAAVAVLVLGSLTDDLTTLGADSIFVAPDCESGLFNPDLELAIATDIIGKLNPLHILLPDNAIGDGDLGRRLAARLGADAAAHVVELKADALATHWQGGATLARRTLPRILLLDPETTDTALAFRGVGETLDYAAAETPASAYAHLGTPAIDTAKLALEEADFIVSAGNGVTDVPTLQAVADAFGAAVGASRVAVDDGKFARDKQIGATGKTVTANVYLAIGISGAVQHLQGIRACRHVIAINTDASAPIAKRADLTIVDDAQQIMEQLLHATRGRNFTAADQEA
ncbi:electron transfer flavoprotein subunit alpha/FixB family protein [Devosia sp.]|uniref:electron transfer flavoprotein subunit alpha/FixB family protein n=1 Tax=Devosia sp. TaxID=1871048 RepID=UPI00326507C1